MKILRTWVVVVFVMTASAVACAQGTLTAEDHKQIGATIDQFVAAWHARDMTSFAEVWTDDAQWINVVGMRWVGREQIVRGHGRLLQTRYKGVDVHTVSHDEVEIVPGVAVMTWNSYVDAFALADGTKVDVTKTVATITLVKRGDKWLIRAGENVVVDEKAAAHDPGK